MTSLKKRRANRYNAIKSTGPKSLQGRKRVASNALTHGLSKPIHIDLEPEALMIREVIEERRYQAEALGPNDDDLKTVEEGERLLARLERFSVKQRERDRLPTLRSVDRYHRRSANQLIKALKSL